MLDATAPTSTARSASSPDSVAASAHSGWPLMVAAAAILMVTFGVRQSIGLYVSPLNTATGLGIARISLALAIGQFVWGATQPLFGVLSDRLGPARVIIAGGLLLAAGTAAAPFVSSEMGLIASLGLLMAAGAGAGSFSILIGATAGHLPPERRAFAAGFINAGGSFGQFVFAPLNQLLIGLLGWVNALFAMAAIALSTLPLARFVGARPSAGAGQSGADAAQSPGEPLRVQLAAASRDRSYWCLHAGFFTCGFHIAFLVTHLPTEVNLCGLSSGVAAVSLGIIGLANIAGSLTAGALGTTYRLKWLLFWVYFSRAVSIALYLIAPKTPLTFYVFAAALGLSWLSTVPPATSRNAVRPDAAVAPDRRILRRVARRPGADPLRRLLLDVVRGHHAGARRRADQPADPGSGRAASGRGRAAGLARPSAAARRHRSGNQALFPGGPALSSTWPLRLRSRRFTVMLSG
jgi:predicted MFS family arabinose efflux permease